MGLPPSQLPRPISPSARGKMAWERVVEVADRQWGVCSRRQLVERGVSTTTIDRLVSRGQLHRLHPGVYAVGHTALEARGRLMASVLRAGPGSMLTGPVGVWWWGATPVEPRTIHILPPGRVRSSREVQIIHAPGTEAVIHNGLPAAPPARALIDLAPLTSLPRLRKAVSEALYLRITTVALMEAELRRGLNGSAAVRAALDRHRAGPQRSRSEKEELLMLMVESGRLPFPELNAIVAGQEVDAVWRDLRLVVEIDGPQHGEASRVIEDRQREMALRTAGFDLIRYSWIQLTKQGSAVAAELAREISRRI